MPNILQTLLGLYNQDLPPVEAPQKNLPLNIGESSYPLGEDSKIKVNDTRPVDPRQRMGAPPRPFQTLNHIGLAAQGMGIDPKLAAALAVTEGRQDYGNSDFVPSSPIPPDVFRQARAEDSLRRLRERASAVGGPIERQLQGYNGMGKLPPGHYGSSEVIDAGKDLPYGKRILDILNAVVNQSPEVLQAATINRPTAISPMAGYDHLFAQDIMKDMNIRQKKPHLLKP